MGNSKKNFWLALSLKDMPILMKTKHPVYIMVFGVVTWEEVVRPFIFSYGIRRNMETYILYMDREGGCWKIIVWQQESVPCNTSRRTQCWLWENFCNHISPNIWPLNFPDCNPLYHYMLARLSKGPTKHQRGTEGKDNDNIYQFFFLKGDCWKGLQEIPKLYRGRGWNQWRFFE